MFRADFDCLLTQKGHLEGGPFALLIAIGGHHAHVRHVHVLLRVRHAHVPDNLFDPQALAYLHIHACRNTGVRDSIFLLGVLRNDGGPSRDHSPSSPMGLPLERCRYRSSRGRRTPQERTGMARNRSNRKGKPEVAFLCEWRFGHSLLASKPKERLTSLCKVARCNHVEEF